MIVLRSFLLFLLSLALLPAADEAWPTVVMRVVGLCYPERADDLKAEIAERSEVKVVSVDFDRGEVTFAYDPKRTKADDLKHLGGAHGFQIRPRSEIPVDQLTRLDIPVAGLDCKGCALGTANVANRVEGVYHATVDYKAGVVSLRIDPAKTNRDALIDALKKGNVTVRDDSVK
jgi:copper chaperone CopZ